MNSSSAFPAQPVLNGTHQAAAYKLPNGTAAALAFPDSTWQL
jgi:hypothetical protein